MTELERRNEIIRINGGKGETLAKALNGRLNGVYYFVFSTGVVDNPFTFPQGTVISIHSGHLYTPNRIILVGISFDGNTLETKVFNIPSSDQPPEDQPSIG